MTCLMLMTNLSLKERATLTECLSILLLKVGRRKRIKRKGKNLMFLKTSPKRLSMMTMTMKILLKTRKEEMKKGKTEKLMTLL
jgi:hypothetical protein